VSAKHRWIAAIVGLLAANLVAMIVLMVVAHGKTQSKVLPDYQGVVEKK
jgi:hypothetical protein